MVNRGHAADNCIVAHLNMTGKCGGICQDTVVTDDDIMTQVNVAHKEVVVADFSDASTTFSARVKQGEFTNSVVVTDNKFDIFTTELQILRDRTKNGM